MRLPELAARSAAEVFTPRLSQVPEFVGLSLAHVAAHCASPMFWPRLTVLVFSAAALGPNCAPLAVCRRLVAPLVRRKVISRVARVLIPTSWREVVVFGRIAPIQLVYFIASAWFRRLDPDVAEAAWNATHAWATPRIRSIQDDYGGFLRKIAQMLGTATPSMPPALIPAFADSMDNNAGLPFTAVKRIVERELKAPITEVFTEFDETAAATASIAQVHFAVLRSDGAPVAVKVACVGSKQQMLSDMRTMLRAAVVLRRLGLDGGIDLPTIMRSYYDIVPEEFDLRIEARKMRRFEAAFDRAGLSNRVGMARAYPQLCTERVLVMTRLKGTRMLDVFRARLDGRDFPCPPAAVRIHGGWQGLVRSLHLAWGEMVLSEGAFHTDPHPGNLLLLDDGRVGILDWGQTKSLRPEHIELMCRMTLAMAAERYAEIERLIVSSGEFELEELEGRSSLERRMAWVRCPCTARGAPRMARARCAPHLYRLRGPAGFRCSSATPLWTRAGRRCVT